MISVLKKLSFKETKIIRKLAKYLENIWQSEKEFYGLVIGVFFGFLPIHGIQMATAAAVAKFFKKNPIAAIIGTHVTNWWTTIPILYMNHEIGRKVISNILNIEAHYSLSFILYTFTGGLIMGVISSLFLIISRYILISNLSKHKRISSQP